MKSDNKISGLIKPIMPLIFFLLLTLGGCHSIKHSSPTRYYHNNEAVLLYNPFTIDIDPMERLLLINFENDPDSIYVGFEPQVFTDDVKGKRHIVIGWRTDGKIDVYHQPQLRLNPDKYDIAGAGLSSMIEREMKGAFFEVTGSGVQAYYEFTDIFNRKVAININEYSRRKRKPFGLLAPMGDAARSPSSLPLILLHDFYFVRQKNTDISISIEERIHQPDKLPLLMDWSKMYFTRYSTDPLIAMLNPAYSGLLQPVIIENNTNAEMEDCIVEIVYEGKIPVIKSIRRNHKEHKIDLNFDPPFPNITMLSSAEPIKGRFIIKGDPSTGSIRGDYQVEKRDNDILIIMNPSRGWKPIADKLSLRFLYTVAGIFKKWPKTYEWKAIISETEDNRIRMESSWKRTNLGR